MAAMCGTVRRKTTHFCFCQSVKETLLVHYHCSPVLFAALFFFYFCTLTLIRPLPPGAYHYLSSE